MHDGGTAVASIGTRVSFFGTANSSFGTGNSSFGTPRHSRGPGFGCRGRAEIAPDGCAVTLARPPF